MNSKSLERDSEQEEYLGTFLESAVCPPNTMNIYQLDGYLRALCCGPGLAPPNEWLPLVFNDSQPEYRDNAEAEAVVSVIMNLYNFHADQVSNDYCDLPLASAYSEQRSERTDLEQWARGFLQGYIYWEAHWNELLTQYPDQQDSNQDQETLTDKLDAVLYVVSTIADVDLAVDQGTDPDDLEGIFDCLSETLIDCGRTGKTLYEWDLANTNSQKTTAMAKQFVRDSDKVGRNDLCPCGSGNKFKKCCLH